MISFSLLFVSKEVCNNYVRPRARAVIFKYPGHRRGDGREALAAFDPVTAFPALQAWSCRPRLLQA